MAQEAYLIDLSQRKNQNNNIVLYLPKSIENYQNKTEELAEKLQAKKMTLISEEGFLIYYLML